MITTLLLSLLAITIFEFLTKRPVLINAIGWLVHRVCGYKEIHSFPDGTKIFYADKHLLTCFGLRLLPKDSQALSLGNYIFVYMDEYCGYACLHKILKHEYTHTLQFRKYTSLGYVILYLFFLFKNYIKYRDWIKAYEEVPFEVEARQLTVELP